jgi:membrane-associated phospholipid phosphatase
MTLILRPLFARYVILILAAVAVVAVACVSLLTTAAHTPFDLVGGIAIGGVSFSATAPWITGQLDNTSPDSRDSSPYRGITR